MFDHGLPVSEKKIINFYNESNDHYFFIPAKQKLGINTHSQIGKRTFSNQSTKYFELPCPQNTKLNCQSNETIITNQYTSKYDY